MASGPAAWKVTNQTVTTTAALLPANRMGGRSKVIIQNLGAVIVSIGPTNGVTTANGWQIPAGAISPILDIGPADVFAIAASTTADVRVFEA
jgi:hypothetical protein